ncbi:MAG: hypothetical protein ACR2L1_06085 [Pyrinomonadaceae bacterium]
MNDLQILTGDSLKILPTLADDSAQCCVTSPPFYSDKRLAWLKDRMNEKT